MATRLLDGHRAWSMSRDSEGHRSYKITYVVEADPTDGPANVIRTAGLPLPGSWWIIDNDIDLWAWCHPDAEVKPSLDNEPNTIWTVECKFSTKPPDKDKQRCQDSKIEDPLLEPQKVSGSFVKYTQELGLDRFGAMIRTSSFEPIKGQQVEFDFNRPQIKIEQNVADLQLALVAYMVDKVNDATLWGMPARTVKLSNFSWEKKFYGYCYYYYTRILEFDISYTTFDRTLADIGTKALFGEWDSHGIYRLKPVGRVDGTPVYPSASDPSHFDSYLDRRGNKTKVVLNGEGLPAVALYRSGTGTVTNGGTGSLGTGTSTGSAGVVYVEAYNEANFLLLGIPLVL